MQKASEIVIDHDRQVNKLLNKWRTRAPAKTEADVKIRLDEYFSSIEKYGITPTITQLCLCLGCSRKSLWNHRNGVGCSAIVTDMINTACQQIDAVREIATDSGGIPVIYQIWHEKSRNGFSDQQGCSEAERMTRTITSEHAYALPQDILQKYLTVDDKEPTEPLAQSPVHFEVEMQGPFTLPSEHEYDKPYPDDKWGDIPPFV